MTDRGRPGDRRSAKTDVEVLRLVRSVEEIAKARAVARASLERLAAGGGPAALLARDVLAAGDGEEE